MSDDELAEALCRDHGLVGNFIIIMVPTLFYMALFMGCVELLCWMGEAMK